MKKRMNVRLATLAVALVGCGVLCEQAQAIPINGSVEFFGTGTPSGSSPGSPTTIVFTNPWKTLSGIGIYAGVPFGTAATFTDFSFTGDGTGAALVGSVTPLWAVSFGGINYAFDLLALTNGHTATGSMSFTGTGTAHATGFDDTFATWAIQGSGNNFAFTISTSTTTSVGGVPEGGTTVALLAIALVGTWALRRQLKVA
jgi:hypothetical protein